MALQLSSVTNASMMLGPLRKGGSMNWSDDDIIHYFDTHWNVSLSELSRMTGRSVKELKKLLMP